MILEYFWKVVKHLYYLNFHLNLNLSHWARIIAVDHCILLFLDSLDIGRVIKPTLSSIALILLFGAFACFARLLVLSILQEICHQSVSRVALFLFIPLKSKLFVNVCHYLIHVIDNVFGLPFIGAVPGTEASALPIIVLGVVILLVWDHEEVIVATMYSFLIIIILHSTIFIIVFIKSSLLRDCSCMGVVGLLVLKVMAHDLDMILKCDSAMIDLDEIFCKSILLEKFGDIFTFFHQRETRRWPNHAHLIAAQIFVLTALEEVCSILDEFTIENWTLNDQDQGVFNEILELKNCFIKQLGLLNHVVLILDSICDLLMDGGVLLFEILRWIQDFACMLECQMHHLLRK